MPVDRNALNRAREAFLAAAKDPNVSSREKLAKRQEYLTLARALHHSLLGIKR